MGDTNDKPQSQNWEVVEYNLKEASSELLDKYYVIYSQLYKEEHPDEPLLPLDILKERIQRNDPSWCNRYFAVFKNDAYAGTGSMQFLKPGVEADEFKFLSTFYIRTLPEYRRKGVGTAILKKMTQETLKMGIKTIEMYSMLDSGKSFCGHFQGKVVNNFGFNRLDIKDIDWRMVESWKIEAETKTPDTKIEFHERLTGKDWDQYLEMQVAFFKELSLFDEEPLFDEEFFRKDFVEYEKKRIEEGTRDAVIAVAREADGTIIGYTEISYDKREPHKIDQDMTGVLKERRGKNLGKRLKAEMLLKIRDTKPDVIFIATGNDTKNKHMLKINGELGFKQSSLSLGYSFKIHDLATKLGLE
ncbi:MAG: GNAT family N-acetyltransferase [Caldisericales bacterium]|nr:GNAT family N-acetyltransferase [Caldisericales bacterium]